LRAWVLEHVLPVAFPFLAWVHEHREAIEKLGLARFRVLDLPDPRAPLTYEVNWLDCAKVAELIYLWQTDQWDRRWESEARSCLAGPFGIDA